MNKIKMVATKKLTFREGCDKYLEDCKQRSLMNILIKDLDFENNVVHKG